MFDPPARHPRASNLDFALVGHHLALEAAGKLAAEEAHHVARAEISALYWHSRRINSSRSCALAKQDVLDIVTIVNFLDQVDASA